MKQVLCLVLAIYSTSVFCTKEIKTQDFKLSVTENGFEPSSLKVKAAIPTVLKITRKTDATCATEIIIPAKNIKMPLPLNKEVVVNIGNLEKGEIKFGCAMSMMVGAVMIVE